MKKKICALFIVCLMAFAPIVLSGCDLLGSFGSLLGQKTITFVDYDNTVIQTVCVKSGRSVNAISNPQKEGYTFIFWENENVEYDFESEVNTEIMLKAVYQPNNQISSLTAENLVNRTFVIDKSSSFMTNDESQSLLFRNEVPNYNLIIKFNSTTTCNVYNGYDEMILFENLNYVIEENMLKIIFNEYEEENDDSWYSIALANQYNYEICLENNNFIIKYLEDLFEVVLQERTVDLTDYNVVSYNENSDNVEISGTYLMNLEKSYSTTSQAIIGNAADILETQNVTSYMFYEFHNDNTVDSYTYQVSGENVVKNKETINYTIQNNKIVISANSNTTIEFLLQNNKLYMISETLSMPNLNEESTYIDIITNNKISWFLYTQCTQVELDILENIKTLIIE